MSQTRLPHLCRGAAVGTSTDRFEDWVLMSFARLLATPCVNPRIRDIAAAGLVAAFVVTPTVASAVGQLVPHRAVYDMTLDNAGTSSGISELIGRMVFEFRGSACEGYTQSMRLVTKVTDRNGGGSLSDMRTSSWEAGSGEKFRFNSTTLRDARVQERISGKAVRQGDRGLQVNLRRPMRQSLQVEADVMFPVRHTRELLAAAQAGQRLLQANVYDGSEQGRKYFSTTSYVGNKIAPGVKAGDDSAVKELGLSRLNSWPVSISYYDSAKEDNEGLPDYQMAFRFFENGVTRGLKIDYGTFRIDGRLANVTYFKEAPCGGTAAE